LLLQFCNAQKKALLEGKRGETGKGKIDRKAVDDAFSSLSQELKNAEEGLFRDVMPHHLILSPKYSVHLCFKHCVISASDHASFVLRGLTLS
jgi:hypothetical protein